MRPSSHQKSRPQPLSFLGYLRHDWRSIVAVTAVVHLAVSWVPGLAVIEAYTFFVISTLLPGTPPSDASLQAIVVTIDQRTYDSAYRERSPLDRCVLTRHLQIVYESEPRPSLVVADLDLSPAARADSPGEESPCEKALERLIADAGRQTRTVLMNPFPVTNPEAQNATYVWQRRMKDHGVLFGDALLPIEWGVALRYYCRPTSLASVSYGATVAPASSPPGDSRLAEHCKSRINPQHYQRSLAPVEVSPEWSFKTRMTDALRKTQRATGRGPVVFVGGGWGETDSYVTPVGELYGVDIHAASYLSIISPLKRLAHLVEALADLLVAGISGFVFRKYWQVYFRSATARSRGRRERAVGSIFVLGFFGCLTAGALLVASWWLLGWGLWTSPTLIIVGMLIHDRVESLRSLTSIARPETITHGPDRATRRGLVTRFFWRDVWNLYRRKAYAAACLVFARRLLWLVAVVAWVVTVFHESIQ